MKAIITSDNLAQALHEVKTVMPSKTRKSLSILLNAHLKCEDGHATLTGTDLRATLSVSLTEALVEEEGEVLLPVSELLSFVGKTHDKIVIEQKDEKEPVVITIPNINAETKLFGLPPAKDFPPISKIEGETTKSIDVKTLCSATKYISPYAADEESRPILTSICYENGSFTATDGFRLANYRNPELRLTLPQTRTSVTIPSKVLATIAEVMNKENVPIDITIDKACKQIHLESNKHKWISQLIQGTFPDYIQLFPRSKGKTATLSAPLLAQRLGMLGTPDRNECRMQFFADSNYGVLSAHSEGRYYTDVEIPANVSEDCKITLQLNYITWATKHFSEIKLEIHGFTYPVKVTGDIKGLTLGIMPMFSDWQRR